MTVNSTRPAEPVGRPGLLAGRAAVPWSTVLPLAVVLTYADGFWTTTVRGAVGAVERTQTLFVSWLRESTALVPVFVVAVILAQMCALRWYGTGPHRKRVTLVTVLLTVATSTFVGTGMIVANAVYDYHLESGQTAMIESMHGVCVGSCVAAAQQATLVAETTAVLYASGMLLVTNLVLIGWMLAIRGGRFALVAVKQVPDGHIDVGRRYVGSLGNVQLLLVTGLAGSAAIHVAVVPEHLTEWTAAGAFFVLLSVAEIAVAAAVVFAPVQRAVWLAGALVSIAPIVVWLYSRTAGLPFGPEAGVPEAVGLPDCVAGALELCTLAAAIVLLRPAWRRARRRPASAHVRGLVVTAVLAVTVIGVAGTAPNWFENTSASSTVMVQST